MEIVIKIHEKDYQAIKNRQIPSSVLDVIPITVLDMLMKGTPLPEGHGRLIDENELKKEAIRCEWSRSMYGMLEHTLSYMKPIIEADKEEEVDE